VVSGPIVDRSGHGAPERPAWAAAGIDAAIVDLDGTLVDTLGDFEAALSRMLVELGLPAVSRDFIARTVGKGSEYLVARTLAESGASADLQDRAFQRYQHHYGQVNGRHARVFPGVVEGLALLRDRARLPLACLTNKPTAHARALLAAKGLAPAFAHVFGGDAFERKKPDPLPVLRSCAALGHAPARTLVIGDSANDVAAARGAGCPVVLVSHGYNHGQPVAEAGADAVVDRLDEVAALLGLR
jgi:phosphoglycolate phosphatase